MHFLNRCWYSCSTLLHISAVRSFLKTFSIFNLSSWIFCGRSAYTLDFTKPHGKKSHGVKSGERGGHGMLCDPRPIQRLGNCSSKKCRTLRPQWGGAPSCMNTMLSCNPFSSTWGQNFSWSICRYMSLVTFWSKKNGPYVQFFDNAAHTVVRGEWRASSLVQLGLDLDQNLQFCLFKGPSRWKWASSEKVTKDR